MPLEDSAQTNSNILGSVQICFVEVKFSVQTLSQVLASTQLKMMFLVSSFAKQIQRHIFCCAACVVVVAGAQTKFVKIRLFARAEREYCRWVREYMPGPPLPLARHTTDSLCIEKPVPIPTYDRLSLPPVS